MEHPSYLIQRFKIKLMLLLTLRLRKYIPRTKINKKKISGNVANNNDDYGIYLDNNCNYNTISENTVNNNDDYGIFLNSDCDNNNITDNYIYFNTNGAIKIITFNSANNLIKANILVSNDVKFIIDEGTSTFSPLNHYLYTPPWLFVEAIAQSFSKIEFIITVNISSNIGLELSDVIIQVWWNGTTVQSNNITELGNGLYNISLTSILVEPGENPILLNMTVSAVHHSDKYFGIDLFVDPEAVDKGPDPESPKPGGILGDNDDDDDDGDKESSSVAIIVGIIIGGIAGVGVIGIIVFSRRKI